MMALPSTPGCPRCGKPMEAGIIGTNGKLLWEKEAGRLLMTGQPIGRKIVTTIQNYSAWRCQACHMLTLDYSHET